MWMAIGASALWVLAVAASALYDRDSEDLWALLPLAVGWGVGYLAYWARRGLRASRNGGRGTDA